MRSRVRASATDADPAAILTRALHCRVRGDGVHIPTQRCSDERVDHHEEQSHCGDEPDRWRCQPQMVSRRSIAFFEQIGQCSPATAQMSTTSAAVMRVIMTQLGTSPPSSSS